MGGRGGRFLGGTQLGVFYCSILDEFFLVVPEGGGEGVRIEEGGGRLRMGFVVPFSEEERYFVSFIHLFIYLFLLLFNSYLLYQI